MIDEKIKQVYTDHPIDKEQIRTDVLRKANEKAPKRTVKFKPVLAACLTILVLIACFSGYTIVIEAKEYNVAVTFFDEYSLPTEGLSRDDIKNVYRDIETGTFTYGKTADVLEQKVGGYEILQSEPTPEDLETLWNYASKNNGAYFLLNSADASDGVTYNYETTEEHDDELGFDVFDKTIFRKYEGNTLVWSVEFDFAIDSYVKSADSVIVYGYTPIWSSNQPSYARVALINMDGNIQWNKILANGFEDEYICAVLPDDHEISIFSRGDLNYLCLSILDMDGNVTSFTKNAVGNYGIWNAAKLGDGYLVQLGNVTTTGESLVKVNSDGSLSDSFTYTSDDANYFITDMIEFGGNVYLSAYSVPKLEEGESDAGGRYEIAAVLNYLFDNEIFSIPNEDLTKLVRDNYTAVLLVCNTTSGTPQEFYSISGSLGGNLALSDTGNLLWDVESITDTFYSPATSSFTIGGASCIFRYVFDEAGEILSQEKTSEIAAFRR